MEELERGARGADVELDDGERVREGGEAEVARDELRADGGREHREEGEDLAVAGVALREVGERPEQPAAAEDGGEVDVDERRNRNEAAARRATRAPRARATPARPTAPMSKAASASGGPRTQVTKAPLCGVPYASSPIAPVVMSSGTPSRLPWPWRCTPSTYEHAAR